MRCRPIWLLLPAAAVVAACGDSSTESSPPFELTFSAEVERTWTEFWDAAPYYCEFTCLVSAEGGSEGEHADWTSGEGQFLVEGEIDGQDTFDPTDWFGSSRIAAGEVQEFTTSTAYHKPHSLQLELHARHSSGESLTRTASVDCPFGNDVMTTADLAGVWTATKFEWTSTVDPSFEVDFLDSGGSLIFETSADGSFSGEWTVTYAETYPVAGTIVMNATSLTEGTITVTFTDGLTISGAALREGRTLHLTDPAPPFDFDSDGTPDLGTLEMSFELS